MCGQYSHEFDKHEIFPNLQFYEEKAETESSENVNYRLTSEKILDREKDHGYVL